jgi:hypothetical protein
MTFVCYIHVDGVMTPHVRLTPAETPHQITDAIAGMMEEWPHFDLIEVYDDEDRSVAKFAPGGAMQVH